MRCAALLAALVVASVGCKEPRSPAPRGAHTSLTAGEMERLRAGMARLRPGMTRAEVFAALAVELDGLAQIGTGPASEATTIYVVGDDQLDLTWDASDQAHPLFLRGALTPRGPH